MQRIIGAVLAAMAIAGTSAVPATASPVATIAKTCSHGYVRGVIGGQQKCLRRGEFCSYTERSQYHRYGFNCVLLKPSNTYHLEPR